MRASEFGARLEPEHAALGANGLLTLTNATATAQIVSIPSLGVVRQLAPGEAWEERVGPGAHGSRGDHHRRDEPLEREHHQRHARTAAAGSRPKQ